MFVSLANALHDFDTWTLKQEYSVMKMYQQTKNEIQKLQTEHAHKPVDTHTNPFALHGCS